MFPPGPIQPGTQVRLCDHDPDFCGGYRKGDREARRQRAEDLQAMCDLQERLYAEGKQSLLIILQGLDTAGKDGTIRHVLRGLDVQGCAVTSFKVPTAEELAHDFLWRVHPHVPAAGQIAVFNRSHYEDVLVVRVHGLAPESVWRRRYDQINAFEELLAASGTRILKFFLHISQEEQKRRLEKRLATPAKQWKISAHDLPERRLWDDYLAAYEEALSRCSTAVAPWYVIPANHKWYRNLAVAHVIARTLREMDPQWPPPQVDLSQVVIE